MEIERMPLEGQIAPPMANGEVIFEAPWHGRVFGMARVLCEAGEFDWPTFQAELISQISAWDQDNPSGGGYAYFDLFLQALTEVVSKQKLVSAGDLLVKEAEYSQRPHGHDHD